jgi:hypothetical protein
MNSHRPQSHASLDKAATSFPVLLSNHNADNVLLIIHFHSPGVYFNDLNFVSIFPLSSGYCGKNLSAVSLANLLTSSISSSLISNPVSNVFFAAIERAFHNDNPLDLYNGFVNSNQSLSMLDLFNASLRLENVKSLLAVCHLANCTLVILDIFFCVRIFSVVSIQLAVRIGIFFHGSSSFLTILSMALICFHTLSVINVHQYCHGSLGSLKSLKNVSILSLSDIGFPDESATYLNHVLGSI